MKLHGRNIESTPFAEVHITDKVNGKEIAWFRMYWTEKAGTYGHQVVFCGNHGDYAKNYFSGVTGGCGYCKPSQAFEDCLYQMGIKSAVHDSPDRLLHKYGKGNYYELSLNQLKKAVKG